MTYTNNSLFAGSPYLRVDSLLVAPPSFVYLGGKYGRTVGATNDGAVFVPLLVW